MTRITALTLLVLPAASFAAGPVIEPKTAKVDPDTGVHWYDIRPLGVEGQAWADTKAPFDRLPAKAEKTARPPVWNLSRHSAGLCVRFVTGATTIHARWTVTSKDLAMPHMPATGVSGLDLYVKGATGKWQWVANGRPTAGTTTAQLATGLAAGEKEYLLYLPLYNGVSSVEIGLPEGTVLKNADPRPAGRQAPLVFYGTSITQGGCASRPGMVHTAILGRMFDRPAINLGFSGNGTLDADIAALLGELDAAVFVLDCLPNLTAAQVAERTEPFVKALRQARPTTPILLVEDRTYANAPVLPALAKRNADSRDAYTKAFDTLVTAGDKNLFYLAGDRLIGDDGEGTVDGSHPTDLGFMRQADAFAEALDRSWHPSSETHDEEGFKVEICEATAADIPTVRMLFAEYAAGLGIDLCFQRFDEELADLPGSYAPPAGRLLVAWDEQTPAGCIAFRRLDEGRCELKRLYVRAAYRGRGLGRLLAGRALEEADAAGYGSAYLDTLPFMREAIALYRALGFAPTEPYCHNPVPGALFFARSLGPRRVG